MISISWFVAGICVMCVILPWMLLALFPVTVFYGILLLHYRKSGTDLQRIDAMTRSPIQSMLSEGKRSRFVFDMQVDSWCLLLDNFPCSA